MFALSANSASLQNLSGISSVDVFVKRRNVFSARMVGAAGKSTTKKASKKKPSTQELLAWPTVSRKSSLRRNLLHSTHLFTVPDFLSQKECEAFVRCAEARGLEHQGSGGPAKGEAFRDNERLADYNVELASVLWQAGLRELFQDIALGSKVAVGLNPNIRLYRYGQAQRFGPHYDESVEIDGGGATEFTLLVYLTGDLSGGETVFYDRRKVVAEVAPVAGMALFHVHGARCLLHEAKSVMKGVKCMIISDIPKNAPMLKRLDVKIKAHSAARGTVIKSAPIRSPPHQEKTLPRVAKIRQAVCIGTLVFGSRESNLLREAHSQQLIEKLNHFLVKQLKGFFLNKKSHN